MNITQVLAFAILAILCGWFSRIMAKQAADIPAEERAKDHTKNTYAKDRERASLFLMIGTLLFAGLAFWNSGLF